MSNWQLTGPGLDDIGWKALLTHHSVIYPGPGARIEYIGPRPQYNWAEGTLYLQAVRGAARLRRDAFKFSEVERLSNMRLLWSLEYMLRQLGLTAHG